ncbi:MAG: 2-amino-4-hydroxy-6-hydroxymethyldihydropteridine diphosphokinase [Gammaproteobacteria bacterium]|nr:2-amino-4-hydroxy-6-hydroxymethyldihydropteridine diphosphokinase [Gammaproteobacteria bacterium]
MMRVYIGLGSNLAEPVKQINWAIDALNALADSAVIKQSSLYSSPPMGPQDQPDYVNAVVLIDTELSPHLLLDGLQAIEQQQGRVRKRHWGERTIDLDILIYDDVAIDDDRLVLPHPGIADRSFVLYPLAEIAPDIDIPNLGNIGQLVENCPCAGIHILEKN